MQFLKILVIVPVSELVTGKEKGVSELQTGREKVVSKQGAGREYESQILDQKRIWVSNIGPEKKMGFKYWTGNLGHQLKENMSI